MVGLARRFTRSAAWRGASRSRARSAWASATYHQGNQAAFYDLPKRTELYALVGYQRASGTTLDAYGNVIAATASVGDAGNGLSSPSEAVARPDA